MDTEDREKKDKDNAVNEDTKTGRTQNRKSRRRRRSTNGTAKTAEAAVSGEPMAEVPAVEAVTEVVSEIESVAGEAAVSAEAAVSGEPMAEVPTIEAVTEVVSEIESVAGGAAVLAETVVSDEPMAEVPAVEAVIEVVSEDESAAGETVVSAETAVSGEPMAEVPAIEAVTEVVSEAESAAGGAAVSAETAVSDEPMASGDAFTPVPTVATVSEIDAAQARRRRRRRRRLAGATAETADIRTEATEVPSEASKPAFAPIASAETAKAVPETESATAAIEQQVVATDEKVSEAVTAEITEMTPESAPIAETPTAAPEMSAETDDTQIEATDAPSETVKPIGVMDAAVAVAGTAEENAEERKRAGSVPEQQRGKYTKKKKPVYGKKKKSKKKKKIGIVGNIVRGFFAAVAVLILIGIGYGGDYLITFIGGLPTHDMAEIEASLKTMSTIYDDQGVEMKDIYIADSMRELVTYDQIPKNLVNAMVSIEDKTFWSHKGFNVIRMIGALRESYLGGGEIQGTSTISQQLARNIWLAETRSEYSLERKMKEAVFARELEETLTKEEILTHYLNMIPLGNHSYGVGAAAKLYFDKDVEDLDLLECASLAALPQSPSKYSMITTVPVGSANPNDPDVLLVTDEYVFLYNEDALPRIHLVLELMLQQGYITETQYDRAVSDNLRRHLHPKPLQTHGTDAFFLDWMVNDVAEDIVMQYPDEFPTIDDALQLVYSGGLEIYSTFNKSIQDICTDEFENPANYPVAYMSRDNQGNIIGDDREIVLFDYNNMFVNRAASEENQEQALSGVNPEAEPTKDDLAGIGEPWFRLNETDFEMLPDGGMRIFAGSDKRLGIYRTSGSWGEDISVEFKDFYTRPPNSFYIIKGGKINIPAEYKKTDATGNLILAGAFFDSDDNIFTFVPLEDGSVLENGAKGEYWIDPTHFTLDQPVVQPQGGATIIEHQTGRVKAMVGGRGIEGAMQYNRALSPRQPGSTMKPIGVYAPALQMTAEGIPVSYPDESLGEYWTAVSIINDEPMEYEGRVWPNNWYGGFRGPQTMRKAIEQSINVCAVRAQLAVGNKRSVEFLKKLGITSIVESGEINDLNPSALGLGGMTQGISPLESASAYGTFANKGVHVDPIGYTVVKFRNGEILLDGTPRSEQVMDSGAAFIMQDMLRTAVSNGIASRAGVRGVPVAGKTGTSSEQVDAWFAGFTPKYVSSVWIGIDVKMRMSQNSAAAAAMFSRIMTRIYEDGEEPGAFSEAPSHIERGYVDGVSDFFQIDKKPDHLTYGDKICVESGYLATPDCPVTERRVVRPLNGATSNYTPEELAAMAEGAPVWYCPIHNSNHIKYPVDPAPQGGGGAPPPPEEDDDDDNGGGSQSAESTITTMPSAPVTPAPIIPSPVTQGSRDTALPPATNSGRRTVGRIAIRGLSRRK